MRKILALVPLLLMANAALAEGIAVTVNVVKPSPIRLALGPFFGIVVAMIALGTAVWAIKFFKIKFSPETFIYAGLIILAALTLLSTF